MKMAVGVTLLVPLLMALSVAEADFDVNNFITSLNHLHSTLEEYSGCDQRTEKLWEAVMTRDEMIGELTQRVLGRMDQLGRLREREGVLSDCNPPFEVFRGNCLYLSTRDSLGWPQARFKCWIKGGDLAYPGILQDLKEYLPKTGTHFWIGVRTLPDLEFPEWTWVDGRQLESDDVMFTSIPRAKESDNCIMLSRNDTYKLKSADCEMKHPSVCQIPYHKQCPRSFTDVGGRCLKLQKDTAASWAEAEDLCREDDAELARPGNVVDTEDYVNRQLQTDRWRVWIGGKKRGKRSTWKWTDGHLIDFPENWNHHEEQGGQCLALAGGEDYQSEPLNCGTALAFLCQKDV